jgi:hypothetical protein
MDQYAMSLINFISLGFQVVKSAKIWFAISGWWRWIHVGKEQSLEDNFEWFVIENKQVR